jgi:hypothetical protein
MPMKKYKPEQILTRLRQIEVKIANRKTTQSCREVQITAETFLPLEERVRPAEARPGETDGDSRGFRADYRPV